MKQQPIPVKENTVSTQSSVLIPITFRRHDVVGVVEDSDPDLILLKELIQILDPSVNVQNLSREELKNQLQQYKSYFFYEVKLLRPMMEEMGFDELSEPLLQECKALLKEDNAKLRASLFDLSRELGEHLLAKEVEKLSRRDLREKLQECCEKDDSQNKKKMVSQPQLALKEYLLAVQNDAKSEILHELAKNLFEFLDIYKEDEMYEIYKNFTTFPIKSQSQLNLARLLANKRKCIPILSLAVVKFLTGEWEGKQEINRAAIYYVNLKSAIKEKPVDFQGVENKKYIERIDAGLCKGTGKNSVFWEEVRKLDGKNVGQDKKGEHKLSQKEMFSIMESFVRVRPVNKDGNLGQVPVLKVNLACGFFHNPLHNQQNSGTPLGKYLKAVSAGNEVEIESAAKELLPFLNECSESDIHKVYGQMRFAKNITPSQLKVVEYLADVRKYIPMLMMMVKWHAEGNGDVVKKDMSRAVEYYVKLSEAIKEKPKNYEGVENKRYISRIDSNWCDDFKTPFFDSQVRDEEFKNALENNEKRDMFNHGQ